MHDFGSFPHADQTHRYAGMTCGNIAEQLIAIHPRGHEATHQDIEILIAAIAGGGPEIVEYRIGGQLGGQLGGPGTWVGIATTSGNQRVLNLSPFYNGLMDPDNQPEDATVLMRVQAEMQRLADAFEQASGERIVVPKMLRRELDAFSGRYDVIFHEAPGGEDRFHGSFSHVPLPPKHSPSVAKCLADGFDQIRTHHRHWARIEAAIAETVDRARQHFERLGARTGKTHLITVETTNDGDLSSVATTTALDILGDTLRPTTVMLNLRNPHRVDKDELDGLRIHARDHKRRSRILAGRDPIEAMTICPILARTIPTLRTGQRALLRNALRAVAGEIRFGPEDEEMDRIVRGLTIKDGHIVGTVDMPRGTWRGRTFQVRDMVLPQTMLTALAGRPFSALIEDPRLIDIVIDRASCDAKGRLNAVMQPIPGVPLRDALAACAT